MASAPCAAPQMLQEGLPRGRRGHGRKGTAASAGSRRRDRPPRPACGGRGIAGQGEDDRGLARPVMPGDGDPGPCLGPAVEGGLGEAGGRLRHALRDRAAGGPDARRDRPGAGDRRRAGARHRPGPGGRGDRLAGSGLAGATGRNRRQEGRARNLPRGDRRGGPGGARQLPRHRHGPGPGLAGAARPRLPGRLRPVAGAVAQAAGLPLGGPGAVGGAAPDLRARGRDRGLRAAPILDRGGGSQTTPPSPGRSDRPPPNQPHVPANPTNRVSPFLLASFPSQQVESDFRRFGNPPRFNQWR